MLRRIIDRPVSVTMILLSILALGVVSVLKLPVGLIPDVPIPYVTVQVSAPAMSSRELDESVVKPLRQRLIQTDGLEDIVTCAKDGSAVIRLTFNRKTDINYAYIEVNEGIDRVMPLLSGINRPRVMKASATDIPAFYLNLTLKDYAPEDFATMSRFAEEVVAKRIEQLPQVAMVDISGGVSAQILIIPDEESLKRLGMDMKSFDEVVKNANVSLDNLTIRDGEYHYNVRFQSFAASADDIANVYFRNGDKIFQIKDVAQVLEQSAPESGGILSDGKRAVVMAVIKQSEAKMSELKSSIAEQLEAFGQDYPQIDFTLTRDQTRLLEYSINNLLRNIAMGILFSCIVIFLFMKDFRSPTLVALTIPSALLLSMLVFRIVGLTVNIISLSGLLLGVGMMVDNSIVLIDNITARWNRGDDLRTAVLEGTGEMSGPMLSSVLTTCAVFIPLVFISGLAGALFHDQAIAVTIVLLSAYVLTITVIPVFYYQWYKRRGSFRTHSFLSRFDFPSGMRFYEKCVSWGLRNRWFAVVVLLCSVIVAFLCIMFVPREKLPPMTYTDAVLNIEWNENISFEENLSRISKLEEDAGGNVVQITSMVGAQYFVLSHDRDMSTSEASVYFKCEDTDELERAKIRLREMILSSYPEAVLSFEASGNIFDVIFAEKESALVARLRPVTSPQLELGRLNATIDAVRCAVPYAWIDDVPVKDDVLYVADPEKMTLYGVAYSDLLDALTVALNGNKLFTILKGTSSVPVMLGTAASGLGSIMELTVMGGNGDGEGQQVEIPVSELMLQTGIQDFKALVSGAEGDYYPLNMNVPPRTARQTMAKVRKAVSDKGDFEVTFSGAWFSNINMAKEMLLVLAVAVLLLFLILASQFESLVQPLIILSEILIDIAASLGVMWFVGVSVNLMSLIGLVVICGIVINDSILKIDTINRLRKYGMGVDEAIVEAGHRRLKAIIMTSLTTILAVVPFLSRGNMGDDLQYPMSVVIIVGMTIGTIVSLFLVPVMYSIIYNGRR